MYTRVSIDVEFIGIRLLRPVVCCWYINWAENEQKLGYPTKAPVGSSVPVLGL